jgi:hypothetical protein
MVIGDTTAPPNRARGAVDAGRFFLHRGFAFATETGAFEAMNHLPKPEGFHPRPTPSAVPGLILLGLKVALCLAVYAVGERLGFGYFGGWTCAGGSFLALTLLDNVWRKHESP